MIRKEDWITNFGILLKIIPPPLEKEDEKKHESNFTENNNKGYSFFNNVYVHNRICFYEKQIEAL